MIDKLFLIDQWNFTAVGLYFSEGTQSSALVRLKFGKLKKKMRF